MLASIDSYVDAQFPLSTKTVLGTRHWTHDEGQVTRDFLAAVEAAANGGPSSNGFLTATDVDVSLLTGEVVPAARAAMRAAGHFESEASLVAASLTPLGPQPPFYIMEKLRLAEGMVQHAVVQLEKAANWHCVPSTHQHTSDVGCRHISNQHLLYCPRFEGGVDLRGGLPPFFSASLDCCQLFHQQNLGLLLVGPSAQHGIVIS